jgi:aspartate/methionine/tyrosine aminotransferase
MHLPNRIQAVQTPIIPVVGELIRAHPGTVSLGQGVVHYGPPREALDGIAHFLNDPNAHKYGPVAGIPPLLEALGEKLAAENGIRLNDGNALVVTAGGNMAFMNAVLALTDPGDEVILPTPYYFNHEMAVTTANATPVLVPTDDLYQLRLDALEAAITPRTRALVTVSPNNPTGAVYPEGTLRAVNALCKDRGIVHLHDEAYEYFTYGGAAHFSPASIPGSEGHTVSLFSLSKSYGFASWRIGYMVVPAHQLGPVKKIQDTILICPPLVSQYVALGALGAGSAYCKEKLRSIAEVRRIVEGALKALEPFCEVPPADGAFYFFIKVHTTLSDMEVVERLVKEHRVAVIPGSTFGTTGGCTLRVAYAALERETVEEGIGRLVKGLREIGKGA